MLISVWKRSSFRAAHEAPVIAFALLITSVTFLGLTIYAWNTTSDMTGMGPYLFAGLLALLAGSLGISLLQMPLDGENEGMDVGHT